MVELPTGTVTFLFSDIEGSTTLVRRLGGRYEEVLAEHRRVLRNAFGEHAGLEVGTEGDSFFVVFHRAREGALAAAAAQRALADQRWPEGVVVRVRMGLHTGEPGLGTEGYYGLGVHRAARIMAAGHGGQVLASEATAAVMADDELDGITLRDLGMFELKDFDQPQRIYQLEIAGMPVAFPPLKVVSAAASEAESVELAANFELLAASLRADANDMGVFVEALADKVCGALPDNTRVERVGLRHGGRVRALEVSLGEQTHRLEHEAGRLTSSRTQTVHGIDLKHEEMGLDEWISSFAHDLAAEAARSERGRAALERLIGA